MLVPLGLTVALIVIAAALHSEIRSALYGVVLSNGVEVLVSADMYREIVRQYRILDDRDDWNRWDQAVLDVLRPTRPQEWKFLVRSLGYQVAAEGLGTRRRRHTVNAGMGRGVLPKS